MTPTDATPTMAQRLFGRQRELEALRGVIEDASRGRGRLYLLEGEAGIGKTSVLEALAEMAGPTDVRVLWGRCWEGGGAPTYWPWVQVLRELMAGIDPSAFTDRLGPLVTDLAQVLPELADHASHRIVAPGNDSPGARFRLFDAIARFLSATAVDAPILVVLDDLHAADEASLLLLEFVAGQATRVPLGLVGAYRDAEVAASPRLTELLSAVARHGDRLRLQGLDRSGISALYEAATGRPASLQLVARIEEMTDGNPFLVKQLARLLSDSRERRGSHIPLPHEAHAIVSERLGPLPEPQRRVLDAASVLGRVFDVRTLAELTDEAPASLINLLEDLRDRGVLEQQEPSRWSFSHALLRESVYDQLSPSARAALHRLAAASFRRIPGSDDGGRLAAIADHSCRAAAPGDTGGAVEACRAAAEDAMGTLAYEEAARWYERALEVLRLEGNADRRRHHELLAALGAARFSAGQLAAAREAYRQAVETARSLGDAEALAVAALGFFGLRRIDADSLRILEMASTALPDTDSPVRAKVLLCLGGSFLITRPSEWRRWVVMCDEGLAMARRIGDGVTLAWALLMWHRLQLDWNPQGVQDRLAAADEALELVKRARAEDLVGHARTWRVCDLFEAGEVVAAAEELHTATLEAEQLRLPNHLASMGFMQSGFLLLRGHLDDAEEAARRAWAIAQQTGFEDFEDMYLRCTIEVFLQRGDAERAAETLHRLRDRHAPELATSSWLSALEFRALELGWTLALSEDDEVARLDDLLSDVLSWTGPPLQPVVLSNLADACWRFNRGDGAEVLYGMLRPFAGRLVSASAFPIPRGAADRHLGQLATLLGRLDEAEAHFQDADARHRRWQAPFWLARGQADYARMRAERAGPVCRSVSGSGSDIAAVSVPQRNLFRRAGEYWTVVFEGREVRLRDSKGLTYLGQLLREPGHEFHALDLAGAPEEQQSATGHAGALLDSEAKAAYRRRLMELEAEIEDATADHDLERAARARAEKDFLVAELAAAVGLGGRDRMAASAAERARQSVTRAVRGAIRRLAEADHALGEHLRTTVRTGTYCAYEPDARVPIVWE